MLTVAKLNRTEERGMVGNTRTHGDAKPLYRLGMALVLSLAMTVALACVARAQVVAIDGRPYGVMPTPTALQPTAPTTLTVGSPTATASRAQAYGGAEPPATYHGGGLMFSSTLYLIFWDPEGRFSWSYMAPIVQFAEDLQADQALTTDEFSLTELYANAKEERITGNVSLGGEALDTTPYPARDKANGCETVRCLTDPQIQSEIMSQIAEHGWPSGSSAALQTQYLLYTPSGVSVCLGSGSCTTSFPPGFCAYHGEITRGDIHIEDAATYSVLPDVPICDPGEAPLGVDGTLDSEMHEIVESATDPQPGSGYVDENGREIADKCVYPAVSTFPAVFGTVLGGNFSEGTAFNELIDGHTYYTQAIWTNTGGCVARIGPTPSFTTSSSHYVDQPTSFDAGGSYDLSGAITTYEWNFGDGSPTETTSSPAVTHVYLKTGTYQVSLRVSDESGFKNASTQTRQVTIGTEPPPPPPPSPETENSPSPQSPSGEPSGTTSTTSTSPTPPTTLPTPPAPKAKPAALTRKQKLARALKACQRLEKHKRQRCIAAAKKRFGPRRRHRKR